mmetsp:Transcript_52227/g.97750  ORF Transcript_52227/g.97750 Transcript_52227/m.97750 type:complete len:237 (-) Transcript_52227:54-764(-)
MSQPEESDLPAAKRARKSEDVPADGPRVVAVLGLGNPDGCGRRERHSLGARVVAALLDKTQLEQEAVQSECSDLQSAKWLKCDAFQALFIQPQRPINDNGPQLYSALTNLNQLAAPFLAIVDDCWLPLGTIRFREKGSSGGHKGLEGIESTFACNQNYHRLRLGIGGKNLKEFVTGSFSDDEEMILKPVLIAAVRAVEAWLHMGPEAAQKIMSVVNAKSFVKDPVFPSVPVLKASG